jgi:AraC-like DNA-binding protein
LIARDKCDEQKKQGPYMTTDRSLPKNWQVGIQGRLENLETAISIADPSRCINERQSEGQALRHLAVRGGLAAWQQRSVAGYIEQHLARQIPLPELAYLVGLSTYHFARAFRQSFGVPPHRYHIMRRIERAKTMLSEHTKSVTEIGLALGFNETSAFTATFRKLTGLTPSAYARSEARTWTTSGFPYVCSSSLGVAA